MYGVDNFKIKHQTVCVCVWHFGARHRAQNSTSHINVHNSPSMDPVPDCVKPVHTSVPVSLTFFLILSPHLWLGLPSSVLHSLFLTTVLHTFLSFPCRGLESTHLIHLHVINLPIIKSTNYEALPYTIIFILVLPPTDSNVLLSTLFALFCSHI